jgi:hypothetical protein
MNGGTTVLIYRLHEISRIPSISTLEEWVPQSSASPYPPGTLRAPLDSTCAYACESCITKSLILNGRSLKPYALVLQLARSAIRLTSFRASSKPSLPSLPFSRIISLTGAIAAFRHVSRRSEPDSPSDRRASVAIEKSGSSLVCASICYEHGAQVENKRLTKLRIFTRCS